MSRLTEIATDANAAAIIIDENPFIKKAREEAKEALHSSNLTEEARTKLYLNFVMQLALGMTEKALAIASESDVIEEKLSAAKYEKLAALAKIKKEFGYKNATDSELGEDSKDGLIDLQKAMTQKQIDGFDKDMYYKANKSTSEMISMLAMNGTATPEWMPDVFRVLIEAMTDGKVNIKKVDNPDYVAPADEEKPKYNTTVSWDKGKTEPDGLA
jgi:hypothetical protein